MNIARNVLLHCTKKNGQLVSFQVTVFLDFYDSTLSLGSIVHILLSLHRELHHMMTTVCVVPKWSYHTTIAVCHPYYRAITLIRGFLCCFCYYAWYVTISVWCIYINIHNNNNVVSLLGLHVLQMTELITHGIHTVCCIKFLPGNRFHDCSYS